MMNHHDDHAKTSSIETADAVVHSLSSSAHTLEEMIETLQDQLLEIDRQTDAAFRSRNELAKAQGHDVYSELFTFLQLTA